MKVLYPYHFDSVPVDLLTAEFIWDQEVPTLQYGHGSLFKHYPHVHQLLDVLGSPFNGLDSWVRTGPRISESYVVSYSHSRPILAFAHTRTIL